MVASYPVVPEIRKSLASLYNMLANYLLEHDLEGRLHYHQRSQQLLEEMATLLTDADRLFLSGLYHNISDTLILLGRRSEALSPRLKALEVAERLHADNPAVKTYRFMLARSLKKLGETHQDDGRPSDAEAALRRARTILEGLAKDEQGSAPGWLRLHLNDVYVSLGRLAGKMGRPDEASELVRLAVADRVEAVIDTNRDQTELLSLGYVVWCFVQACDALVEVRGPIEPLLQARARFERLEQEGRLQPATRHVLVWLDIRIAKAQRLAGRLDEARKTIRRIESEMDEILRGGVPPSWYSYGLACALAQLSTLVGRPEVSPSPAEQAEIQGYQDRAMDALRRAVAEPERSRAEFRADPDLDPLRARPDYQALLLDLAFPADPFAQ
jgi:tetratricopeptide (TPR) repeat protein